ncbi:GNAT family N-acetyltransferase [Kribbella antibiotica]|uniref:GNAT family N-acetyltransferase n=1 Tax=Kribbella antibiotica TaxID=190195 RepID=UPI001EDFD7A1|nr:GNAT family N-acetyltransferase [Kribbella antibiotica]
MSWPHGITARPLEKNDVQAWADLLAAREQVDQGGEHYTSEDLLEELENPQLELSRDTVGLWADGQLVGFGQMYPQTTIFDVDRQGGQGAVHPAWRRRGLGTALMEWLIHRAGELHLANHPDSPGEVRCSTISTNAGAVQLFRGLGFEETRYFLDMKRPLDEPVPAFDVPEGFRLAPFDREYDEALRLTHNEVFRDHWGSTPRDPQSWQSTVIGTRAFRPELSYLVLEGETIAAYVLGYEYVADVEATGVREAHVGRVGTRREYRGRGLARVALAEVLAESARAGFQRAGLGVDADGATGALGLYEGLGFGVHSKWITFSRAL